MNTPGKVGYFADPVTKQPLGRFQTVQVEHLEGKPLKATLGNCVGFAMLTGLVTLLLGTSTIEVTDSALASVAAALVGVLASLHVWWIKDPQYRLLQPLLFIAADGEEIPVEEGYVFNGLSVPWWLWWLCPADSCNAFAASAVHDSLCDSRLYDSVTAARYFWEAMVANGFYAWGSLRNWAGVRYAGPKFSAER